MAKQMTPLLRPLRDNSGTIYVFPSAVEDIGLNLDSRSNRVSLSKFVVLNLPETDTVFSLDEYNPEKNYFNFTNIPGIANIFNNNTSLKTNNEKIAAALQNYMMNFETVMINQEDYDYSLSATVSERVFWKFLKETGAIRWEPINTNNATLNGEVIYKEEEDSSTGYRRVVQSIGQISGGNSISEDFGMYNETYVNIPSTYGASEVFFKVVEDNNYRLGEVYTSENEEYLAGRNDKLSSETYTINSPVYDYFADSKTNNTIEEIRATVSSADGLPWYKYTDEENDVEYSYFTEGRFDPTKGEPINYDMVVYGPDNELEDYNPDNEDGIRIPANSNVKRMFRRSRLDGVQTVIDIDEIDNIYDQLYPGHPFITYDSINIDTELIHKPDYDFNAILLYYSVYDKDNNNELATNLFGIVFLSSPEVNTMSQSYNTGDEMQFTLPIYKKIKSNGAGSSTYFGTGYSFKINIRSLSIYDNTDAMIMDNTTTAGVNVEDFKDVMYSLNKSVDIMNRNSQIMSSVYKDYKNISLEVDNLQYTTQKLEREFNKLNQMKFADIDADRVYTTNLVVGGRAEISGYFHINGDTDFDIPRFNVAELNADSITTGNANIETLTVGSLTNETVNTTRMDVSTLVVNGPDGGVYLDDCDVFLSNDSEIYRQVIEPIKYTMYSDGGTYSDHIMEILDKTEIGAINGMFEIIPSSLEKNGILEMENTSNLYTAENGGGYVNYMGYIPMLIEAVRQLNKKINE